MSSVRRILIAFAGATLLTAAPAATPSSVRATMIEHTAGSTAQEAGTASASATTVLAGPTRDHPGNPGTPVFIGVVVVMLVWGALFAWRAQKRS